MAAHIVLSGINYYFGHVHGLRLDISRNKLIIYLTCRNFYSLIMRNQFDDAQLKERFEKFDKKLKKQFKAMPPLEEIHNPDKPGSTDLVPYDLKAYAFFEEYKKDLDAARALKTLNITRATYNKWLDEPKFTDVLNRIHKAYEDAVLMDAKTVAGWSVQILQDIHGRFKEGDTKAASALAAMAGNMLRASGNFKEATQTAPQVLIQINTGDPSPKETSVKDVTPSDQESDININIKSEVDNDRQRIADLSILRGE